MGTLIQDVRYGLRMLAKNPGFTAIAVITLALGIGANTAIFTLVNGVVLRPLPFPEPDRLVQVVRREQQGTFEHVSVPMYAFSRIHTQVLDDLVAYDFAGPGVNLGGGDHPELFKGIRTSVEYFSVFGAKPVIGRTFTAEEGQPGGPRVALISHQLWTRRFGADPGLFGRSISLNGEPWMVIGVLRADFQPYPAADLWLPLQVDVNSTNQGNYLLMAGRIKSGISLQSARAQMKMVGKRFSHQYPQAMGESATLDLMPLQEFMTGNIRPALTFLSAAVGFVLLIACANVANLLLARATVRKREIGVRISLGARPARIVCQLLTESLLLSAVAGLVGIVVGQWGIHALLAVAPADLPRAAELAVASSPDLRVLLFTVAASTMTGILLGFIPAIQMSRSDVNSALKESGTRATTGHQDSIRNLLVVSEVALSIILLIGAALLIRTLIALHNVNMGLDPRNLITLKTSLSGRAYATTASVSRLVTEVVRRLESAPGVEAAAATISLPLELGPDIPFIIEGRPLGNDHFHGGENWRSVSPHYFDALKIPLLRGRLFDSRDTAAAPKAVLINQAMAGKYWPNSDPIGERITVSEGLQSQDPTRQIVGVVGDVRERGLGQQAPPVMYVPQAQVPDDLNLLFGQLLPMSWVIRSSNELGTMFQTIQKDFLAVEPQVALANLQTMEEIISGSVARQKFYMLLLIVFAGVALVLAAVGIYGVISYAVAQRTHEMGIRIALGAQHLDLLRLVVGHGLRLTATGVVIGLSAAFGLTRLLTAFLFGVRPTDALTFVGVALLLTAVALLACYIPARRATKVDPMVALRYE